MYYSSTYLLVATVPYSISFSILKNKAFPPLRTTYYLYMLVFCFPPAVPHNIVPLPSSIFVFSWAATDTIAVAGPSFSTSRPLSLTVWRVRGGASPLLTSASTPPPDLSENDPGFAPAGVAEARSRRIGRGSVSSGGVSGGTRGKEMVGSSAVELMELHCVTFEGGSLMVPAPRAGLDRAPPGIIPSLLPVFFPGLRAVAPPVQV